MSSNNIKNLIFILIFLFGVSCSDNKKNIVKDPKVINMVNVWISKNFINDKVQAIRIEQLDTIRMYDEEGEKIEHEISELNKEIYYLDSATHQNEIKIISSKIDSLELKLADFSKTLKGYTVIVPCKCDNETLLLDFLFNDKYTVKQVYVTENDSVTRIYQDNKEYCE